MSRSNNNVTSSIKLPRKKRRLSEVMPEVMPEVNNVFGPVPQSAPLNLLPSNTVSKEFKDVDATGDNKKRRTVERKPKNKGKNGRLKKLLALMMPNFTEVFVDKSPISNLFSSLESMLGNSDNNCISIIKVSRGGLLKKGVNRADSANSDYGDKILREIIYDKEDKPISQTYYVFFGDSDAESFEITQTGSQHGSLIPEYMKKLTFVESGKGEDFIEAFKKHLKYKKSKSESKSVAKSSAKPGPGENVQPPQSNMVSANAGSFSPAVGNNKFN